MLDRIHQEHIDNFSERLKSILNTEIGLGNEINETGDGWPCKGGISIFMKRPFIQRYHLFPGIEYRELNDPHYWKAEYFDKSANHLLACPF